MSGITFIYTEASVMLHHSRSQSLQASLSVVGRLKRLRDNGMKVHQDFWRKAIGRYRQPIKKKNDILFDFSRVSPGDQPLTKKPEDSGTRLMLNLLHS